MKVFDVVRQRFVAAQPEELVRQKLLRLMIEHLGFPRSLLAVEKELRSLPHLAGTGQLPQKRADVICFGKNIHPKHSLYPLLLIECKQEALGPAAREQLLGYNAFVRAPFVALASPQEVAFCSYVSPPIWIDHLPSYQELLHAVR